MANLDERTEIAVNNISEFLKQLMMEKKITAEDIIKAGIGRQQVYSVLRMGKVEKPDYKISTFIKILSVIGVHLEFHDLDKQSNHDIVNPNSKN